MPPRVAVAASGGRDSTALLHCTLHAARPLGVQVFALHVHHGLMPQADEWLAHVRTQARRWGTAFDSRRLAGQPAKGESVEAWARRGRYAALAGMARAAGCTLVLLAHHRRDQAETVLLQALRGAGAAGLAAMPRSAQRDGLTWARPWLDQPREAVEAYVRRHRLRHVDDPGNEGEDYTRSRLRRQVWPAIAAAFPAAETALRHTAERAADERVLLDEVAAADLATAADGATLRRDALCALSPPRRRNLLRHWLRTTLPVPVPETLVRRLADEVPATLHARWPAPAGELQLRRGRLLWQAPSAAGSAPGPRQPPA
ncbi:MAG: tRNA lysidine(34) synthetase TilS [Rubrivivax sp.]|nr:tRNA lysidine(34) synthetase TilS [Rubrivivax sp.]